MKRYLIDKKEDIKKLEVIPRLINLPKTKRFIVSVIGPRRAGKTYSIYDFVLNKEKLRNEDFVFINFEDEDLRMIRRGEIVRSLSYHEEVHGVEPKFVFLDEVQALEDWERFVYTIFEKKRYNVFITGSSSKLLSKEIATLLRGRSISVLVLPFSFREMLAYKNIELKKLYSTSEENKIKNLLRTYLENGGFPDIVISDVNKHVFFRDYVDLVVFRDVVERFKIRNPLLVKLLVNSILSAFSKEFSINKVFNDLKSQGINVSKKTLYFYITALEDVLFAFCVRKFSFSLRTSMLSIPKVYVNDTGLINILTSFSENVGRLMENLALLELKRKENTGMISGIYYWKDYQKREVDFVIKERANIKQLIQVTYASGKDEIEKRELKSLLKASDELKCKNLLVITWDYEGEEKIDNKTIKFEPLWKWLFRPILLTS